MNQSDPNIRVTEMYASTLQSFGGQKTSNDTFAKARDLRRWIHEHPDCLRADIPEDLRGYIMFLQSKRLISCKGRPARFRVIPQ